MAIYLLLSSYCFHFFFFNPIIFVYGISGITAGWVLHLRSVSFSFFLGLNLLLLLIHSICIKLFIRS